MEKGTGLSAFGKAVPRRFFDVGIAEEHAVTFAAGLAAKGLKPVAAIYSTFIQRSVDQVIHDVALQNLPVTFALDRSGFVGEDGETHQGLFDIALFRPVPNMTLLAPASESELALMLDWSLRRPEVQNSLKYQNPGPVMIRDPKCLCPPEDPVFSLPLEAGRGVFVRQRGASVCLAFTGSLYPEVLAAAEQLTAAGLAADLYNLRFLKPIDEDYLASLMNRYRLMVFIEEGVREGGFGEYAAELALRRNCTGRVLVIGVEGNFEALGTRQELLQMNGLNGEGIAGRVTAECTENLHRGH
ncbi:MAG: hypothetical protein LBN21_03625 [Treponema sp.]|jgi:1-deoxy-D-xylulose-5-phosphate synthase|nr:hypothetical protein [Treponema sp.]